MIILITSGYPYGGEPFLKLEHKFMPENLIIFSEKPQIAKYSNVTQPSFIIPKNKYIPLLFNTIKGIFQKEYWNEIRYMRERKKLNLKNLIKMTAENGYSNYAASFIYKHLPKDEKNFKIYSYWMATHAIIAAKLKNKITPSKILTRCHGYDIYEYRHKNEYLSFRNYIFENMDEICPISMDGVKYLKGTYKDIDENKIHLRRLGTFDRLDSSATDKDSNDYVNDESNESIDNERDLFTIVSCSNVDDNKRVYRIPQSIKNLKLRWIHFGGGETFEELKRESLENLKDSKVSYALKGRVNIEDIIDFYKNNRVDLLINVSVSEGIPVSMMEAMSFKIPCIGTDVGGVSEIISDKENGFLLDKNFQNNDLEKLISNYMKLTEEEKNRIKENARKSWESRYNADINFKDFYENLCLE